ncbi:uncharacterized protein LOC111871871 isoform X2 [Cryptotermes secundus]|uniref:uncharacterized protein LOC111871871 isoform X2 n=1 Tax=Cryptotermes secundus TaxID=105785 RepID=UPI000CD7B7B3|nr:uncharacterized protein LOC111871871 isoform X2 [Cryptotermes secundus]
MAPRGYHVTVVSMLIHAALQRVLAGDIRCFCNLPPCVSTGYMCKSEGGGCFSDLEDYSDVYKARHGCLEMLDGVRQDQCHQPGSSRSLSQMLWCCHKDMCNHIDSPENKLRFNDSFPGSILNTSEDRLYLSGAAQTPAGYNSNEVWFKAATIAVPICGTLILFILIALAIRILRRDGIEQGFMHGGKHGSSFFPPTAGHATRRPNQYHLRNLDDMSSKKVPLLLQHHNESTSANCNTVLPTSQCIMLMHSDNTLTQTKIGSVRGPQYEKNEANAKLNLAGKPRLQNHPIDYTLLVQPQHQRQDLNSSPINLLHKPNNNTANSNLYQNVNLALGGTPSNHIPSSTDVKLYNKQHLDSVVTWGEAARSASHV